MLRPGWKRLEQAERSRCRLLSLPKQAAARQHRHDPGQVDRLGPHVARAPMELDRCFERVDRLHLLVGVVERVGLALEQRGAFLVGETVREAEGPGVLLGRLAMRTERLGALGRGDRIAQSRLGFGGGFGMVGEPSRIGRADRRLLERHDREAVQAGGSARLDRLFDGASRKLVSELDPAVARTKRSRAEAFLERVDAGRRQRLQQPELDPLRHDRDGVEQRPCGFAQRGDAGKDGIPDRLGDRTIPGGAAPR